MLDSFKTALVLAPHTDDGEFGCGGAINRLVKSGVNVFCVAFSAAEGSLDPSLDKDTLRYELAEACAVLSIPSSNVTCHSFPVRYFPTHRQEILEVMVRISRDLNPDLVFLPSSTDTHQDHKVIFEEGFRAFKRGTILGYEAPWNNSTFHNSSFIKLNDADVNAKISALRCYKSQSNRPYASPEFIRALALTRGVQIGTSYAECFEMIRLVV